MGWMAVSTSLARYMTISRASDVIDIFRLSEARVPTPDPGIARLQSRVTYPHPIPIRCARMRQDRAEARVTQYRRHSLVGVKTLMRVIYSSSTCSESSELRIQACDTRESKVLLQVYDSMSHAYRPRRVSRLSHCTQKIRV